MKPKFIEEYVRPGVYLYCCSAEIGWDEQNELIKKENEELIKSKKPTKPLFWPGTLRKFSEVYFIKKYNENTKRWTYIPVPSLEKKLHVYVKKVEGAVATIAIEWPPTRGFIGEYLVNIGMLKSAEMI